MNKGNLNRIWMAVMALVLVTVSCSLFTDTGPKPVETTTPPVSDRAGMIAATVQIYGLFNKGGKLVPGYVGSGTLISPNGLILTNAHVADPTAVGEPESHPDALAVGLVVAEDKPPTFSYRAEVVAIDGYLDLAVIRIAATLDGSAVNPADLRLPYVQVGDSDLVHVGDHISIFGFPLIGGETITYTDGNVSGFSPEESIGDRAWIKTDATISGGNSGGLAANDSGQIIGVPTRASSGASEEATDCRVIQDTNGDGVLDNRDTCIPIGGFINALRPVNLARPLINAAQNGMAYNSPYGGPIATSPGSGSESFGQVKWLQTDTDCKAGQEVSSYPSGVSAVMAAFDFGGMTDGQSWGSVWTSNGEVIYQSRDPWSSGASGNYTYCLFNRSNPIPDGNYTVQFFVGDDQRVLTQGTVVVGSGSPAPSPQPGPSGVTLIGTVTDSSTGKPVADAYVFVLVSGVTYDNWSAQNYPQDKVLMWIKTDANGNYRMPSPLARNTPYTIVVSAKGYYDKYGDNLVWNDTDPAEYRIDTELNKP